MNKSRPNPHLSKMLAVLEEESRRLQIEIKGQRETQNLKPEDKHRQENYERIVKFKSQLTGIETETDDEENKSRQSRSESTTANSARASQFSTNTSSRDSLTSSIFSEPLTKRSSTNSLMSSHSLDTVEPFLPFDFTRQRLNWIAQLDSVWQSPSFVGQQFDSVEVEEDRAQSVHDCQTALPRAENKSLPSTGCNNCRARKVKVCHHVLCRFLPLTSGKCDEARPACASCSKTGHKDCEYRNRFELAWRDQTDIASERAKGKAATAPEPPAGGAPKVEGLDDSTPNFQTECKYWCTVCHRRCVRKDIWQLHEARCYWPEAQYSCPYCDEAFDSQFRFRVHHSDKHASSLCVVRCADTRTRRAGWGCGFCAAYLDRWGERCNHVGDHFETGSRGLVWEYSNVIRGLLRQPELARHWQDLLAEKHGPNSESRLTILFSKPETGRPDPDLQDILEFRRPEYDLEDIVRLAYGLGVRPHLNDAVDETAAETEYASKLSDLVLSEEGEKDSPRYVKLLVTLNNLSTLTLLTLAVLLSLLNHRAVRANRIHRLFVRENRH